MDLITDRRAAEYIYCSVIVNLEACTKGYNKEVFLGLNAILV